MRDSYAPGTFSWTDLATTDPAAANAFYGALLGWEGQETPAGDAGTYWMMRRDGRAVAGMSAMGDEERVAGAPPAWLSYVTVEDTDATAARAAELGGAVVTPPFDVVDAGRVALVQDPQGAMLALWQPRSHVGAALVNEPGAMVLNQLNTDDPDAAARFYSDLFGWSVRQVASQPQPYWGIDNADSLNGGVTNLPPGVPAPPHWLVYFATADLDHAAETIAREGGQVVVPAMAIQSGRMLVARDPQGAHFALVEGVVQHVRIVSDPVDPESPGAQARASGQEERPSVRASLTSIRLLAGSLGDVPSEIKAAPARAVVPPHDGMPQRDAGPLRRALRAAAWPLMVAVVSGGLAILALALTDGLP